MVVNSSKLLARPYRSHQNVSYKNSKKILNIHSGVYVLCRQCYTAHVQYYKALWFVTSGARNSISCKVAAVNLFVSTIFPERGMTTNRP
jgi:hypothetical protein